ncbi:RimJ/RimL family protein N-acetyltransferase [Streptomyces sp. B4I13]|uniref:GNAT family N-acetyltransferase n=1 Tax=Streptomyces sp. B4I13 TaxID=3042271 RepID=UPI00278A88B7|nr:GNAT family protein [Streptomyces sp. B4I13]MDQ0964265.1 RimJ/RimL family protein N-acetyltransferase [Streptomyces sp. B4I13]
MAETEYRRFVASEVDSLVRFLARDTWPFHVSATVSGDEVRAWAAAGVFDSDETRTFWITVRADAVGLIRLMDLGDGTPLFDLRIASEHRGRGMGPRALAWLTRYVFTEFPDAERMEGTTRQDNAAMRRTFEKGGYVKEAHYRDAWPGAGGRRYDAVGYAILRRDWATGTVTPTNWHDEPF